MAEREIWKPVPGFEGYEVSDLGRVRSVDRVVARDHHGLGTVFLVRRSGKILIPQPRGKGRKRRLVVTLANRKQRLVHKLVMLAFVGEVPEGMEVAHNDGNGVNNVLANLRYDTPVGNSADKLLHDTHVRGERHKLARLTREDVLEIRNSDLPYRVLAEKYGVTVSGIKNVRNRRTWRWLDASDA